MLPAVILLLFSNIISIISNNTNDVPSFNKDSPSIKNDNFLSIEHSFNVFTILTGSVPDNIAPNIKLSDRLQGYPIIYLLVNAIKNIDIITPGKAKSIILGNKFLNVYQFISEVDFYNIAGKKINKIKCGLISSISKVIFWYSPNYLLI